MEMTMVMAMAMVPQLPDEHRSHENWHLLHRPHHRRDVATGLNVPQDLHYDHHSLPATLMLMATVMVMVMAMVMVKIPCFLGKIHICKNLQTFSGLIFCSE